MIGSLIGASVTGGHRTRLEGVGCDRQTWRESAPLLHTGSQVSPQVQLVSAETVTDVLQNFWTDSGRGVGDFTIGGQGFCARIHSVHPVHRGMGLVLRLFRPWPLEAI